MKKVVLNNQEYELIKDYKDGFNEEEVAAKFTDYFDCYDYVVGDIAYSRLRLKGFYDASNKKSTRINNYDFVQEYIGNYCSYDCKHFILKKIA